MPLQVAAFLLDCAATLCTLLDEAPVLALASSNIPTAALQLTARLDRARIPLSAIRVGCNQTHTFACDCWRQLQIQGWCHEQS